MPSGPSSQSPSTHREVSRRRLGLVWTLLLLVPLLAAPSQSAGGNDEITICHYPPGNPENVQTITIPRNSLDSHLAHGDYHGECVEHPSLIAVTASPITGVTAGTQVALTVRALSGSEAAPGIAVEWSIPSGGGRLDQASTTTAADGTTTVVLTTAAIVGTAIVAATAAGHDGSPVQFSIATVAGPLASLQLAPAQATVGPGATVQFTVAGADANGNPVAVAPAWTLTCGTIDGAALFTVPVAIGTCAVTATQAGVQATTVVTVVAGPLAAITVAPATATLAPEGTQTFTATGADAHGNAVPITPTWSAGCGTVEAAGAFLAPRSTGVCVVTAASGSQSATAVVTVVPGPVASVSVAPATATLTPTATQGFAATARDAFGNVVPAAFDWSATCGTVTSDGGYAAPSGAQECRVTAAAGATQGTAAVTVQAGPANTITVAPATATLLPTAIRSFSATATDAWGNPATITPGWTSTCGAVDADGAWTAPTGIGACDVVASANGVEGRATATVIAGPLTVLAVAPATSSLVVGSTLGLAATGTDAWGNPAAVAPTWTATCGTVAETGTFTAPTLVGTCRVTAEDAGRTGTATVTVTAGPLSRLAIVGPIEVVAGTTAQLSLVGHDAYGNAVTLDDSYRFWDAPTQAGPARLTFTLGGLTATHDLTVVAGPLAAISVTGPSKVVGASTTHYALAGTDRHGNPVELAAPSLAFLAPGATGTFCACYEEGGVQGRLDVLVVPAQLRIRNGNVARTVDEATPITYLAEALGADGSTMLIDSRTQIAWALSASTGGAWSENLLAPATAAGIHGVSATLAADPAVRAPDATLQILPGRVAAIKLVPGEITVTAPGAYTFQATAFDRFGNSVTSARFQWSHSDASVGTLDPSRGRFQATTPGTTTITALHEATGILATATTRVVLDQEAVEAIQFELDDYTRPVEVTSGSSFVFLVKGLDADGNLLGGVPVQFSVQNPDIGIISKTGVFTAFKAGSTDILAKIRDLEARATVEVVPGPMAQIRILPPAVALLTNDNLQFQAVAMDGFGNIIPGVGFRWFTDNALGAVDPILGAFTAGPDPGIVHLTATSFGFERTAVIYITAPNAVAGDVNKVKAASTTSTLADVMSTSYILGATSASKGAKIQLEAPSTTQASNFDTADIEIDSDATNLAIMIETQPGTLLVTPDEVDVTDLMTSLEREAVPEPGLYITVTGTENGRILDSARLNEILGPTQVNFRVPRSYFAEHGLDPATTRLLEYSEGRKVRDDVTTQIIATSPTEYTFRTTLKEYSSFVLLATPTAPPAQSGAGGSGGCSSSTESLHVASDLALPSVAAQWAAPPCSPHAVLRPTVAAQLPPSAPPLPAGVLPVRYVELWLQPGAAPPSSLSLQVGGAGGNVIVGLTDSAWRALAPATAGAATANLPCCGPYALAMDTVPPTAALLRAEATPDGRRVLLAQASDNLGLAGLEVFLDGRSLGRLAGPDFAFDIPLELGDGPWSVRLVATDIAGWATTVDGSAALPAARHVPEAQAAFPSAPFPAPDAHLWWAWILFAFFHAPVFAGLLGGGRRGRRVDEPAPLAAWFLRMDDTTDRTGLHA